jgi:hypothetical protein
MSSERTVRVRMRVMKSVNESKHEFFRITGARDVYFNVQCCRL